ncbi:MAG: CapA family protein, partial [Oscillospiraceae bacterium]|nr:CapA family protein [Oscillospiraceae bacterium]
DYWNSHENAIVCGAYRNEFDKNRIRTGEFGGIIFSFLSYTENLNGLSLPDGSDMIIGNSNDIDGIKEDIKKAKDISDICVVALHWGVEDSDIISDWQRTVAAELSEAGADIIIGNHPHVLRDIEEIEREDGSVTLCAYSLGNFISAQSKGQNLIGGVLEFDVSMPEEKNESPKFENIRLVPVITHYDGNYRNVRLYPLSEYTRDMAESHGVKSMSKFGYEYIFEILEKNINEKYFDKDEYYKAD